MCNFFLQKSEENLVISFFVVPLYRKYRGQQNSVNWEQRKTNGGMICKEISKSETEYTTNATITLLEVQ